MLRERLPKQQSRSATSSGCT